MKNYLVGKKIKLIRCNDPYVKLPSGIIGTVRLVDALGTIHVDWENGSSLGLCEADGDSFTLVS